MNLLLTTLLLMLTTVNFAAENEQSSLRMRKSTNSSLLVDDQDLQKITEEQLASEIADVFMRPLPLDFVPRDKYGYVIDKNYSDPDEACLINGSLCCVCGTIFTCLFGGISIPSIALFSPTTGACATAVVTAASAKAGRMYAEYQNTQLNAQHNLNLATRQQAVLAILNKYKTE